MGNAILKFIIQKIYEPDPLESEIHFGQITIEEKAKYGFWDFQMMKSLVCQQEME